MKTIGLVLGLLLLAQPVAAAVIEGDIYAFDLTPAHGVVVEIDTTPRQQVVANEGSYRINVPAGSYTLTGTEKKGGKTVAQTTENITVAAEGIYTLDLILFPAFTDTGVYDTGIGVADEDTDMPGAPAPSWVPFIVAAIAIVLAMLGIVIYRKTRRKAPHETAAAEEPRTSDVDDVVSVLRKLGGRATQKELRKELPYSEAKVSLILTELEHKGRITKIKRGRANIVVLK